MKASRCRVDETNKELQLVPLGVAPMRRIALQDVLTCHLGNSGYSLTVGEIAIDIEVAKGAAGTASAQTEVIRLATADEQSANALVAALSLTRRTMPGDEL